MAKQEKDSAALEEKGKEFKGPFHSDVTFPESPSFDKPENEQTTKQVESHSDVVIEEKKEASKIKKEDSQNQKLAPSDDECGNGY